MLPCYAGMTDCCGMWCASKPRLNHCWMSWRSASVQQLHHGGGRGSVAWTSAQVPPVLGKPPLPERRQQQHLLGWVWNAVPFADQLSWQEQDACRNFKSTWGKTKPGGVWAIALLVSRCHVQVELAVGQLGLLPAWAMPQALHNPAASAWSPGHEEGPCGERCGSRGLLRSARKGWCRQG